MRDITHIVVHCSATPPSLDIGTDEIRRWHTEERGWTDIGYHFVCRRDGTIEEGRPLKRPGAHVKGHNHSSIGICWVGGISSSQKAEDNRTADQSVALYKKIRELKEEYPQAEVLGHRDFPGVRKACPCFDVRTWYTEQCDTREKAATANEERKRTEVQSTIYKCSLLTTWKQWILNRSTRLRLGE